MSTLRDLPSVDQVFRKIGATGGYPDEIVKNEIRAILAEKRDGLREGRASGGRPVEEEVEQRLEQLDRLRLRRVINATGVILHTNLGRAPLPRFELTPGYSNLEYNLAAGKRGRRDDHVAPLLRRVLGTPGIVVNNNAAAVFLVLNELASGGEVIVSRGELIEIGDGFRIPDIMTRSAAVLREVGTTNRTRIEDYQAAFSDRTRLIMRVHPSNFHMTGFTSRPSLKELAELGRERGLPVYEDLGSGSVVDLSMAGITEPLATESLCAGANLISFSCDKLLGGPQAGVIAGDPELVERVRRNPLYRAFRVDKLILQALQATLHYHLKRDWQRIPVLRMILAPLEELRARADRVRSKLENPCCEVRQTKAVIGGGSTPDQTLPTWVVEVSVAEIARCERRLREGSVPVIARVGGDKLILDMRTVADDEESLLVEALLAAIA